MNLQVCKCTGCSRAILSVVNEKNEGRDLNDCKCPDRLQVVVTIRLTRDQWIDLIKEGTLITSIID